MQRKSTRMNSRSIIKDTETGGRDASESKRKSASKAAGPSTDSDVADSAARARSNEREPTKRKRKRSSGGSPLMSPLNIIDMIERGIDDDVERMKTDLEATAPTKRGRGRPKGSKNKKSGASGDAVPRNTGRLNRPLVASPKPWAIRPRIRDEDEEEPAADETPADPLGLTLNA